MAQRRDGLIVAAMCLGIFLCTLDTTIMNIVLPAIQTGLHSTLDNLSWAINGYTIVFAIFTIPLGRLADMYGKNKIYLAGLLLFGIGSSVCGAASTSAMLIVARVVQSFGAAIVFPVSMTIGISHVSVERRQRAIAALGITQGLAAALGPNIGGIVAQFFSWRAVFYINIPIVMVAILLVILLLPFRGEPKVSARIDSGGLLLSITCLYPLTLSLIKGQAWGWNSAAIVSLFSVSAVSLALFIWWESRTPSPMIRLKLFTYRQFCASSLAIICSELLLVGVLVILPTFLTKVQGESELSAALLVMPISLSIFFVAPLSGMLRNRIGTRPLIFGGFLMLAFAYFSYYHLSVTRGYGQLIATGLLTGIGFGLLVSPLMVIAAADFKGELLTDSQSVTGVFRQIGLLLAVAIFISGLTTNLAAAKAAASADVVRETVTLSVAQNERQNINQQIVRALHRGQSETNAAPVISVDKERILTASAEQRVKNDPALAHAPAAVRHAALRQVDEQIHRRVIQINRQVAVLRNRIHADVKRRMTHAFTALYGAVLPFALAACLIAFVFRGRRVEHIKRVPDEVTTN
ncbi:MAG: MFS transporter [Sporolactobacillus sp.]